MNILGLVFSIAIMLSLSFSALFLKGSRGHKVNSSFLGHCEAYRKLMYAYESAVYNTIEGKSTWKSQRGNKSSEVAQTKSPAPLNPSCARISLAPLLAEGKEAHPLLYKLVINTIAKVYGPSLFQNGKIEPFLDLLLKKSGEILLKNGSNFCPEKLELGSAAEQLLFYKMLKGTKDFNFLKKRGFPPFLEFFSFSPYPEKPCLQHAHPDFLGVFFGSEAGYTIYQALHQKEGKKPLSETLIEQICRQTQAPVPSREFLSQFDCQGKKHLRKEDPLFVGLDEEAGVRISKKMSLSAM